MEKLRTRYKVSYNAVSSLIQADIQHMKSLTSVQAASDDITMIDVYEAPNTFLLTSPSTQPQNINRDRDYPEEVLIRRFSNVHFPVKESSEHLTSGGQDASSLATPPSSQFDSGTSAVGKFRVKNGILLCSHDNETMNTEYTREPLHEDQFESEEDNSKFGRIFESREVTVKTMRRRR
ncbi:hypothetical protein BT96DRAFT_696569 [Gymnopus androsaceus JB14]|uniref:Uncharacterized protein n=1 Tax=Gymnopus androsaceus JB14 TaxID=1447944 RepID=A0A6A4ICJ3_9AGAR|nr:hypothetical protein BT96DRAFT_696569 [Gymnopus androsaceus JB14]